MELYKKYITNKVILDVGCVAQVPSSRFVKHQQIIDLKPKYVVGVDTNIRGVEQGIEKGYNLKWCDISDSYTTSFLLKDYPDKHFDNVFMLDVIEHIDDCGSALKNINTIIKSGGHVIVTTPNAMGAKWHFQWAQNRKTNINPDHVHWYCLQTMTALFKRHGFEFNEMFTEFDSPGLACAFKKP